MVKFIDYQIWADNQLIEVLKELSDEQFTKIFEGVENSSVENNVAHILGTNDLWLNRLKGVSLDEFPHLDKNTPREDLFKLWHSHNDEIREFFKDEVLMFFGNSDACVCDDDFRFCGLRVAGNVLSADGNLPAVGCVFDGVDDDMIEGFSDQIWVYVKQRECIQTFGKDGDITFF